MLNEVLEYSKRLPPIKPGFSVKSSKWAIIIDNKAEICGMVSLGDGNNGKTFSCCPEFTFSEMIAGSIVRSQFLIESLSTVALFYIANTEEKEQKKYLAKHRYFIQQLEQASETCSDLALAAVALKNSEQLERLQGYIEKQQPR